MRIARKGFTLVEILIVVVILGILAAIVVPQFTSASQSAVKGALQTQLQTISSQIELYRVNNQGKLPHNDASDLGQAPDAEGKGSWGIMVSSEYMKDEPFNGYIKSSIVEAVDDAVEDDSWIAEANWDGTTDPGWLYDTTTGSCWAYGFDDRYDLLANEGGNYGS